MAKLLKNRIFLLLFLLVVFDRVQAKGDAVAKVIVVEGSVIAVKGEQLRPLQEGSLIYRHDVIQVDVDARAQFQFTDGSVVNLVSDSEYKIDSYRHGQLFRKNRNVASLSRGGLRMLSGEISEEDPDNYQIKTPAATIGLRGTGVQVAIEQSTVLVGVLSGAVNLANTRGIVTVRAGESASVVRAAMPTILPSNPPALNTRLFAAPPGGKLTLPAVQPSGTPEPKLEQAPATPATPATPAAPAAPATPAAPAAPATPTTPAAPATPTAPAAPATPAVPAAPAQPAAPSGGQGAPARGSSGAESRR